MKNYLWIALVSSALLAGTACKDDESVELRVDESRERLNTQRADLRDDVKEIEAEAKDDWEATKAELRVRLDRIDARLEELKARSDEESKQAEAQLRERRDQLAGALDRTEDKADTGWEKFKADVRRGFDEVEAEIDAAF